MLRDLLAVDDLAQRLVETAPKAVEAAGGAATLIALHGTPTGALFWSLRPMREDLWCAMAAEQQAPHRVNTGE
ncbi:MAG: hypothetical protein NTAFB05_23850 [Nitrobacter sp.]|uniref:hypothetical protein n=1 Tax=Nitrobacter sp. TaxID=29420 RepID=UPI00387DE6BA